MPGHRNPTPESSCAPQCREAGFWVEHSTFCRNADTQNAQCGSVDGYRNPRNARKTRADEPVDLDVSDNSALIPENYLLATASAQPKADTVRAIAYSFNPSNPDLQLDTLHRGPRANPHQITCHRTCPFPRNNVARHTLAGIAQCSRPPPGNAHLV